MMTRQVILVRHMLLQEADFPPKVHDATLKLWLNVVDRPLERRKLGEQLGDSLLPTIVGEQREGKILFVHHLNVSNK